MSPIRTYENEGPGEDQPIIGVDKAKINSSVSREAVDFDTFRRDLIENGTPVSGNVRSAWLARISELADRLCPNDEVKLRKPGLATRLFSAEIAVPYANGNDLENMVKQLTVIWGEIAPEDSEWQTFSYPDRRDAYWEVVVSTEEGFVTAAVKLRTASFYIEAKDAPSSGEGDPAARRRFDAAEGEGRSRGGDRGGYGDRPQRPPYGDRPPRPAYGDRPQRPSYGDRPERPPYQDRNQGGDRPPYQDRDRGGYGDRPQRPPYGDRPQRPPYGDRPPRPSYGDRPERPPYDRQERPQYGDRDGGGQRDDRGGRPYGDRPQGDRPQRPPYGDRPQRPFGDRPQYGGDRPSYGDRPQGDRPPYGGDRPQRPPYGGGDRPQGGRPPYGGGDRPQGGRPPFGGGGDRPQRPWENRGPGGPPSGGDRPFKPKPGGFGKPFKKAGAPDWVKKKKGY